MATAASSPPGGYEPVYRYFDSPLMREVRREAYGEDIGQHSWVTADELRADIARLRLDRSARCLDLGCGPGGPLTFLLAAVGCRGTGVDRSPAALDLARARGVAHGLGQRLELHPADLDRPLPFEPASFDAVISLDVVLHLGDRAGFFAEVRRVLRPGGRLLLTDAGVLTGPVSADELRRRGAQGPLQVVPPGWNEGRLADAGLRVLESEDRTASAGRVAAGRLAGIRSHRTALETLVGPDETARQVEYLETVLALSERRALSRIGYLAERPVGGSR